MYDLNNITFLTFVRLDNDERVANLKAMYNFYKKTCINYVHIIIEDDVESKVPSMLNLSEDDVYVYMKTHMEWRKCEGFNKGIKLAKTNVLNFIDTDVIIHPRQLLEGAKALTRDPNAALIYPYNGLFLGAEKEVKDEFCTSLDYDTLLSKYPSQFNDYTCSRNHDINTLRQYINKSSNGILIHHIDSKGGCVMGRRDSLIKCNGYNPNFVGWGYEDDEIPVRISKLGFGVGRLEGKKKVCWHLHHNDGKGSKRDDQPNYEHNKETLHEVCQGDLASMQKYITKWRL
tara:strand:+ start:60 stop:920 length:861 start_codon:yes stop_codon:yes gene_type:complete